MLSIIARPPEILCRILQSCDTFEATLALARTCKSLYAIWTVESKIILLCVGRNSVLSFDDALITVRVTELVRAAYVAGKLPPDINIPSLSATNSKPNVSEIRRVLDLKFYVEYLEYRATHHNSGNNSLGLNDSRSIADSPAKLHIWKINFHRSAYKLFIAGAVLSRAYQQPFFECEGRRAIDGTMFFYQTYNSMHDQGWHPGHSIQELPMTMEEFQWLDSFPIYKFVPNPGWEKCFGHFGDWLIAEAEDRLQLVDASDTRGAAQYRGQGKLREVMQLIAMYGLMEDMKGGLVDRTEPYWSRNRNGCYCDLLASGAVVSAKHVDNEGSDYYISDSDCELDESYEKSIREADERKVLKDNDGNQKWKLVTCTTNVVRFGSFVPSVYKIRSGSSFSKYSSDIQKITRFEEHAEPPIIPNLKDLSHILHCLSGRPNHNIEGGFRFPAPHPPLHLFVFLLRQYFGYRFDSQAFDVKGKVSVYEKFIQDLTIFTDKGNWDGMLSLSSEKQDMIFLKVKWAECVL